MAPKIVILCSQNDVRKTACFRTPIFHKIHCCVCPVDPENRVKTYNCHQNSHVSLFRWHSPTDTNNYQNHRQKGEPKSPKMCQNPSSKTVVFSPPILMSFCNRKCPKTDPQMTPNSSQMAPLGAQGGAWGSHGTPKMSPCRFGLHFGVQHVPKITKMTFKMTPTCPKCPPK